MFNFNSEKIPKTMRKQGIKEIEMYYYNMKLNSLDKSEQMKSSLETIGNDSAKIEPGLFYLKYYSWLKKYKTSFTDRSML